MAESFLLQSTLFLAAGVFAAPLAKRLGIGSVLGYLIAGIIIGPYGLGLIYSAYQVDTILHFAEFGVVILLFLIGLELRPKRLWSMRSAIFGLGGAQFVLTAFVLAAAALALGIALNISLLIGAALGLSSTAFALQILEEKQELTTRHGRMSFSVLLFQDIAVIPLIALIPLFAIGNQANNEIFFFAALKAIGMIGVVIIVGRYALRYLYSFVASTKIKEAMTASALLTVVGVALLMQLAGLSAALGAFLAGALLADSEYRHELEADIAPFGGLLLGLFFTAIGMSLNMNVLLEQPWRILILVMGLISIKACILYILGRWYGLSNSSARRFALAISQGGEFAFVLLTAALSANAIGDDLTELLYVVVTLSMVTTPLLLMIDDQFRKRTKDHKNVAYDPMPKESGRVIIAGFGRFGQIIARILRGKKIPFTALDSSSEQINFVRNFGAKIYFGDPTRLDILRAAQIEKAQAFVLAVNEVEVSIKIACLVKKHFPHVRIYARARNRTHVHMLMDAGADVILRETFLSSLDMAGDILRGLGMPENKVLHTLRTFKKHDQHRLYDDYKHYTDSEKMRLQAQKGTEELAELFSLDEKDQEEKKI